MHMPGLRQAWRMSGRFYYIWAATWENLSSRPPTWSSTILDLGKRGKKRDCTICVAKTRTLVSCAITAQLICIVYAITKAGFLMTRLISYFKLRCTEAVRCVCLANDALPWRNCCVCTALEGGPFMQNVIPHFQGDSTCNLALKGQVVSKKRHWRTQEDAGAWVYCKLTLWAWRLRWANKTDS